MITTALNKEEIIDLLSDIKDPEIPVVTITEMGMLRDVNISDDKVDVIITPTYSGCPAMNMIKDSIERKLNSAGIDNFNVITKYSPAWTTDWMTEGTHEKLREYGIAPPEGNSSDNVFDDLFATREIKCPHCRNSNTYQKSKFGSTPCKSLHYCNDCEEPFEHFKCH
jgi:ring-1,2-phenylacetyl-CoA epoxidase subunit PaaD